MSLVRHIGAGPDGLTCFLVESHNTAIAASRSHDEVLAVDEWAFAVTPPGSTSAKVLNEMF